MDNPKILAQNLPSAGVLTTLYTVPAATVTVVSSIVICNQNSAAQILFRISVAIGGAADTPAQYIYYDLPLDANDTFIFTGGMSLSASDVVRIKTDTANVSFNMFGIEVA